MKKSVREGEGEAKKLTRSQARAISESRAPLPEITPEIHDDLVHAAKAAKDDWITRWLLSFRADPKLTPGAQKHLRKAFSIQAEYGGVPLKGSWKQPSMTKEQLEEFGRKQREKLAREEAERQQRAQRGGDR